MNEFFKTFEILAPEEFELVLGKQFRTTLKTGSRYIVDPPVLDTDDDRVVLVKDLETSQELLEAAGYVLTSDLESYDINEGDFITFRKEDLNLIVTDSSRYFYKWYRATNLAVELNLQDKEKRKILFSAILYGSD